MSGAALIDPLMMSFTRSPQRSPPLSRDTSQCVLTRKVPVFRYRNEL
jgi:hypothetical protein